MRHIEIEMGMSPLKLALKHIGLVAGLKYEVVGDRTVQVRPVLLAGSEGVTLPVLIQESKIQPEYPAEAREARIEGRVILHDDSGSKIELSGTGRRIVGRKRSQGFFLQIGSPSEAYSELYERMLVE